jgi:hypothetical protein
MSGDVVDLEGGQDLVAGGTLVGLVPQDPGTEGLPLRGSVPAAQGIVRPGTFSLGGVAQAAAVGGELGTARDAAQVWGLSRHQEVPSGRNYGRKGGRLDGGRTGGRTWDR